MKSIHSYLLIFLLALTFTSQTSAQLSIVTPGNGSDAIASCDDYASQVLGDPWDMDAPTDINSAIPGEDFVGFGNAGFGGVFSAVTTKSEAYFNLLSPPLSSSIPAGPTRWGSDYPIDTSKYHILSIKLYSNVSSSLTVLWNTGSDYYTAYVKTSPITVEPGWKVYTIDLNTHKHVESAGGDLPWNAKPATGLRIYPVTASGAQLQIDWIMLYGDSGCGNYNVQVDAAPRSGYYSVFLDDDGDPFNGYVKELASGVEAQGSAAVPVSAAGIAPGNYFVTGFMTADYATALRSNPWDMNESGDMYVVSGVNSPSFHDGVLSGTSGGSPELYLSIPPAGIDAAVFNTLSIKISQSSATPLILVWANTSLHVLNLPHNQFDADGDGVFQVNLANIPGWTGTINTLILHPVDRSGITFSLDFVSLRTSGYVAGITPPAVSVSPGTLRANRRPQISFAQPDRKGGEVLAPWNMGSSGDVGMVHNLDVAEILPFSQVNGLTGDFFHGRNISGNDDPINYFSYIGSHPVTIDTSAFHIVNYRLYLEGVVDLVLGSVARVIWQNDKGVLGTSQDIVVFGGWNDYTVDLAAAELEPGSLPWSGTYRIFRVDSHEFKGQRDYYFDYAHLARDDRANSKFAVVFDAQDPDDAQGTVSLYYNGAKSTAGGTKITDLPLNSINPAYIWDTSGVPAGSYYLYAVASDGLNETRRLATGKLVITRDWNDGEPPILSVEAPSQGYSFDSWMQLKGYALDNIQLAQVEVYLDDVLKAAIRPSAFNLAARNTYPSYAESSNAGFNMMLDTSGLAQGSHTVKFVAIDTSGNSTTASYSTVKQGGAAPGELTDPPPDGSSLPVSSPGSKPKKPKFTAAGIDAKKVFKIGLKNLKSGCRVSIYTGTTKKPADLVSSFLISKPAMSFTVKKAPLNKQPFYVKATQECGVSGNATSGLRQVTPYKGGKIGYKKLLNTLRKKLKAA